MAARKIQLQNNLPLLALKWPHNRATKWLFQAQPAAHRIKRYRRDDMEQVWRRGEFEISTERARLDFDVLHDFISQRSYWARGRSRALTERAIAHSLPF